VGQTLRTSSGSLAILAAMRRASSVPHSVYFIPA
jgi:hypothetical protein